MTSFWDITCFFAYSGRVHPTIMKNQLDATLGMLSNFLKKNFSFFFFF